MRDHEGRLVCATPPEPARPPGILAVARRRLRVTISQPQAIYSIRDGHGTAAGLLRYDADHRERRGRRSRNILPGKGGFKAALAVGLKRRGTGNQYQLRRLITFVGGLLYLYMRSCPLSPELV
jgi:hypothetical protein